MEKSDNDIGNRSKVGFTSKSWQARFTSRLYFQLNFKKTEPSSKARNCELHKIRVSVILRELRGISEDRGCVREDDVWLVLLSSGWRLVVYRRAHLWMALINRRFVLCRSQRRKLLWYWNSAWLCWLVRALKRSLFHHQQWIQTHELIEKANFQESKWLRSPITTSPEKGLFLVAKKRDSVSIPRPPIL